MAISHARSNSLPSRPHPVISEFDEHMNRLRDSPATSTYLQNCVDKLLLSPLTAQQILSLKILDFCNITKDALLQTKDCIQQLQSAFRRKQVSVDNEIEKYMFSRKNVQKTIKKALKRLKSKDNKYVSSSSEILTIMKEVETITLNALESFSSFISSNSKPKMPFLSKLMHHKRIACEEQKTNENEFAIVDATLESNIKSNDVEGVLKKLKNLELCIQHFEDGIECLFRKMIKSRASFLNIFN